MAKYKKDKNGIYVFDKRIAGKRCMLRGKTCAEIDKKLKNWLAKQAAEAEEKKKALCLKMWLKNGITAQRKTCPTQQ